MSHWYEPKKEDIDFSDALDEVHIYIGDNYGGAIYTSVKTKDIIEILKEKKLI